MIIIAIIPNNILTTGHTIKGNGFMSSSSVVRYSQNSPIV